MKTVLTNLYSWITKVRFERSEDANTAAEFAREITPLVAHESEIGVNAIVEIQLLQKNVRDLEDVLHYHQKRLHELIIENNINAKSAARYEELRKLLDGGSENSIHEDAVKEILFLQSLDDKRG